MKTTCVGVLKIRGEEKDIIRFLENELELKNTDRELKIIVDGDNIELDCECEKCYLKQATNGFIWGDIYCSLKDNLIAVFYYQKGAVNVDELATISKCYNLDFKISAKQAEHEFIQDIEIQKGDIICNSTKRYTTRASFIWDAPDLLYY